MIYAVCRTNLDDYKGEEWPTRFHRVPVVGEYVQTVAALGAYAKRLRVHEVPHCQDENGTPWVRLDLHL